MNQPKPLQLQPPPQKDWTNAIATLALGQVDLKRELDALKTLNDRLGQALMQLQQAVGNELNKINEAVFPKEAAPKEVENKEAEKPKE